MSNWEIFRHDRAIGVRMPSDNKTKYGAVRYVTIGGFDREDPEQMAEVERIVHMIADAPALLKAMERLVSDMPSAPDFEDSAVSEARALISKHRGEL